jgi:hypothetical protein
MVQIRLRTRISASELEKKVGKIVTEGDYNLRLTGEAEVFKPNGDLLCIYLPKAIPEDMAEASYKILSPIRIDTRNRGKASGGDRVRRSESQTYAKVVQSAILGAFEPAGGRFRACRLTAWTGKNNEQFREIFPLFQHVAALFKERVPDRFEAQQGFADRTHSDWMIPGTPFTTITVNNTYATGVHTDKGDLDEGFSCLCVFKRGKLSGGHLTFPEYRVAVDLQDRDLILMDAHSWHGNTELIKESDDAERISVVHYYRTEIKACESSMAENAKMVETGDFDDDLLPS